MGAVGGIGGAVIVETHHRGIRADRSGRFTLCKGRIASGAAPVPYSNRGASNKHCSTSFPSPLPLPPWDTREACLRDLMCIASVGIDGNGLFKAIGSPPETGGGNASIRITILISYPLPLSGSQQVFSPLRRKRRNIGYVCSFICPLESS